MLREVIDNLRVEAENLKLKIKHSRNHNELINVTIDVDMIRTEVHMIVSELIDQIEKTRKELL